MRRKLWIVLTAIVASLAMAFGISACSLTMNESTMTKEQLEAPVVTLSESGIASWEAVPHAMSYVYKVDEGEEVSVFTRYAQLEDGQTIVVKAKGNALRYSDSPYSVPVTYHATPVVSPDPEQLATPVVSVSEEGLATWEEVENASGYMYKLNGGTEQLFEGETLEYQLEDGQSISVMAKGDGKYYSDSDWSEAKLYTAPVVSQPTKLDTPEVTIDAEGIARWNAIENASAYFYKIDGGNETELEGEDLQVQLEKGQSISVMAKGDGERFTDSDWSEAKTYEGTMPEPQPLATPVISIDGEGLATWDPIPHASGYKYKINGEEAEHVFEGETLEYQLQDNEYIEVKAFSNDAEHYTDSGWGRSETYHQTPVIPTQLEKPVVALEGNVASWAKDPNAVRYEYVITEDGHDGEPVSTEGTSVELEDGQTIKVKAIGDGTNYSDSDWSDPVTYHETHTELTPLATPEVTIDEEGKATWPAVAGAKGYICKVNGEEKPEQEECEITLQSGDTLQVKAVPSDAEKNTESEYSELQTYTKQTEEKEGLLATFELGDDVEDVEGTGQNNDLRGDGNPSASNSITLKDTQEKYSISITDLSNVFEKAWDNAGNGCWKVGGSKEGYFAFVVPEGVEKVVIYVAGYKSNNVIVAYTIGTQSSGNITVTKHSATPEYEAIEITVTGTTEAERTLKFTTVKGGSSDPKPRCKINTIEFYGEPVTKLEKLATPEVKIDKDGNATWEAVPNASSYKYKVNDVEHTLEASAKLEVKLTDKQSITVQAVGDGETYSDSDWSAVKTYTAPVKLGKPEVSISDNGLASWKPIENVTHYEYIITKDGVAQPALTTSDTSVQLEDGWSIKVKAIGDGEHFLDGEYSEEATYTAPEEITLDVPEVTIGDDGKATWTEVKNATGYKYKINDGQEVSVEKDAREVELQPGQSIQVMAVGNNDNIKDSAYSAPKTYTAVLEKPVVSLDGNVASWQAVTGAKSYLYKIGEEGEEKPITGELLQVELEDGQTLYVKAVGDGTAYSDSPWSAPVTYTAPVVKPNYGSEEAPLSVSEALALAEKECVNNGTFTKQIVTMTGKVKETPNKSSKGEYYESLYLIDLGQSNAEILVWTINLKGDVAAPEKNDILTIQGYIKRHTDGKIEFASNGDDYVYVIKNVRGEANVTVECDTGAEVKGLDEGIAHNGDTITFTVTVQEGYELVSVKANGTTLSEQEGKYSYEVHGDVTIQVKTQVHDDRPDVQLAIFKLNRKADKDLTDPDTNRDGKYDGDPATTYSETSGDYTLTITGGSTFYVGAYDEKGNAGFKLGSKSGTGSFTITVPEGVVTIVFYVAGYNQSDTTFSINNESFDTKGESEGVTYHSADGTYKKIAYRIPADTTEVKFTADGRLSINTIEFWGKGEIEKPALASPTLNVNQNTGEVTWEKVDGATGYTYTVNGENEQTIDAEGELKVTLKNNDEISVIAKGDGTTYSDSAPATATYTHEHKHESEALQHDANGHWYECVGCDEHLEEKKHEYAEGVCSECQYAHPEEAHIYETNRDGTCDVCGKAHEHAPENLEWTRKDATGHTQTCKVCHKEVVNSETHTYGEGYTEAGEQHYQTCECGYKNYSAHTYTDGKYEYENETGHYQVCTACSHKSDTVGHTLHYINDNAQGHHQKCDDCDYVTETTGHVYVGKGYEEVDDTQHKRTCDCGYAEMSAHTYDKNAGNGICKQCSHEHTSHDQEAWDHDDDKHWKECSVCGKQQGDKSEHNFVQQDGKDICQDCSFDRGHVHEYTAWDWDDTHHWRYCPLHNGDKKYIEESSKVAHAYDKARGDGVCTEENCHYDHVHSEYHSFTVEKNDDATSHWKECEICGMKDGVTPHTHVWTLVDGQHVNICTCGHQDGEGHTPDMHYVTTDPSYHWQKCEEEGCTVTTENEKASHTFKCMSISDEQHQEKCECGATHDPQNHTYVNGVCTNEECQHEHQNHNYDWVADEAGTTHNHQCTVCEKIETSHTATPNTEAGLKHENGDTHWYTCQGAGDCDLHVNETAHVGKPTEIEDDDENHKLVCECGKVTQETAPHTYGETYHQGESGHYQQCTKCEHKTAETPHDKAQENGLKCTCGKWDDEAIKDLLNGKFSAIENAITELSIDAYEEKKNEVKVDLGDARISMEIVEPSSQNVVSGAKAETGTEYTISFKLGSAKITLTFKIRLTFSKGDEGEAVTADSSVITRELPRKLKIYTFEITADNVTWSSGYGLYTWSVTDGVEEEAKTIGGKLVSNHNDGMQFNPGNDKAKERSFIYSNQATPSPITKVTITGVGNKVSNDVTWKLLISDQEYTETEANPTRTNSTYPTQVLAAEVDDDGNYTTKYWDVKDDNAYYFALVLETSKPSYIQSIIIECKEPSDEAKLDAAIKSVGTIAPITEAQPEGLELPKAPEGITFTWSNAEEDEFYRVQDGKLIVGFLPAEEKTVKLTLEASIEGSDVAPKSQEFTVKVSKYDQWEEDANAVLESIEIPSSLNVGETEISYTYIGNANVKLTLTSSLDGQEEKVSYAQPAENSGKITWTDGAVDDTLTLTFTATFTFPEGSADHGKEMTAPTKPFTITVVDPNKGPTDEEIQALLQQALGEITIPEKIESNCEIDLPTAEEYKDITFEVTYEKNDYLMADVELNKITIVIIDRGSDDVPVKITITAIYKKGAEGSVTSNPTKEVTVTVPKKVEEVVQQGEIVLNTTALGLPVSSSVIYKTITDKAVSSNLEDEVKFSGDQLAYNNGNIQAKKNAGYIYNTTAFPGHIVSIVITFSQNANSTQVRYSFANNQVAKFLGDTASYLQTSSSTELTLTFDATKDGKEYKYFNLSFAKAACYMKSIVVTYEKTSTGGGTGGDTDTSAEDAKKIEAALATVNETLPEITSAPHTETLPTSSNEVTFEWEVTEPKPLPSGMTFEDNTFKVNELPASETTVKFEVTASYGKAEPQTKAVSVVVKAKPTQGGGDITYTLATSDTFKAGIKVVIVYDTYACGTFNSGPSTNDYMKAISGVKYSADKNQITTLPDGAVVWTVGGVADAWTFECTVDNTAYLLTQASTSNAKMKGVTSSESSKANEWKITFGTGNAVTMKNNNYTNDTWVFQCNANNNQQRFGTYKNSQKNPYFYIVSE